MDTKAIIGLIVAVLVLAAGAYLWWRAEQKTVAKKTKEAAANGWTYERLGSGMDRKYRHLPFVDGDSDKVKHVMRGEFRGRPITLFTFYFTETERVEGGIFKDTDRNDDGERDKRRVDRRYGVVVVELPTSLPRFELSAAARQGARAREERFRTGGELVGKAIGNVLGEKARDVLMSKSHTGGRVETGDAAFDETFVVRSMDPDAVRQLLTAEVRGWLMESEHAKKYVVWVDENEIITWGTGTDTTIGKVKASFLNDLVDQLPSAQTWGPPPA